MLRGPAGRAGHLRSGRRLHLTVEPIRRLTKAQLRELEDQVDRTGEFLEGEPQLSIGRVTAGGHA